MPRPKTRIILTYNLPYDLKEICSSAEFLGVNHLHDYTLLYRGGILTAEPKKGHIVDVPVWMIAADEEKQIDNCFPAGIQKIDLTIPVSIDDKIIKRKALLYIVDTKEPMSLPDPLYLRQVAEALIGSGVEHAPIFDAYTRTRQALINTADA